MSLRVGQENDIASSDRVINNPKPEASAEASIDWRTREITEQQKQVASASDLNTASGVKSSNQKEEDWRAAELERLARQRKLAEAEAARYASPSFAKKEEAASGSVVSVKDESAKYDGNRREEDWRAAELERLARQRKLAEAEAARYTSPSFAKKEEAVAGSRAAVKAETAKSGSNKREEDWRAAELERLARQRKLAEAEAARYTSPSFAKKEEAVAGSRSAVKAETVKFGSNRREEDWRAAELERLAKQSRLAKEEAVRYTSPSFTRSDLAPVKPALPKQIEMTSQRAVRKEKEQAQQIAELNQMHKSPRDTAETKTRSVLWSENPQKDKSAAGAFPQESVQRKSGNQQADASKPQMDFRAGAQQVFSDEVLKLVQTKDFAITSANFPKLSYNAAHEHYRKVIGDYHPHELQAREKKHRSEDSTEDDERECVLAGFGNAALTSGCVDLRSLSSTWLRPTQSASMNSVLARLASLDQPSAEVEIIELKCAINGPKQNVPRVEPLRFEPQKPDSIKTEILAVSFGIAGEKGKAHAEQKIPEGLRANVEAASVVRVQDNRVLSQTANQAQQQQCIQAELAIKNVSGVVNYSGKRPENELTANPVSRVLPGVLFADEKLAEKPRSEVLAPGCRPESKRYLTGVELSLVALMAVSGVARPKDEPDRCNRDEGNEAQNDQPSILSRRTYLVKEKDTLHSIAEELYGNKELAWLIADINRANLKTEWVEGKRVIELKARQLLELPEAKEIAQYWQQRSAQMVKGNLFSFVSTNEVDRELLESLTGLIAGKSKSNQSELAKTARKGLPCENAWTARFLEPLHSSLKIVGRELNKTRKIVQH